MAQYPTSSPPPLPISGGDLADAQGNGLECYWQTRSVQPSGVGGSSGTDPALCGSSAGSGTSLTSPEIVRALADTTGCSGLNCGGVPTNPFLEASMPSPALQAVVTLNLSSQTELVNLLAGLLDNSTGGVNGTLELETPFVSSLGLNSVVVSAMANVAQLNSGIYGIPTSLAAAPPPSPPSCSNFVGCAWNAVSGVVVAFVGTVVDGIEGLAGEIWDATLAIAAYFSQMAAGLASVAERAVAATVAAMKAVGSVLEKALSALLAYVKAAILQLLDPVVRPIVAAFDSFAHAVHTADGAALNDSLNNGTVAPQDAYLWGESLSGSIFTDGLLVGAVLAIALTVASLVSLGPGDLAELALTTVVSGIAGALAAAVLLPYIEGTAPGLSSGLVHGIEAYANATCPSCDSPRSATASQSIDQDFAVVGVLTAALFAFQVGFAIGMRNLETYIERFQQEGLTQEFALAVLSVAFLLVSLAFRVYRLVSAPSIVDNIVAIAVSSVSVLSATVGLAKLREALIPDVPLQNLMTVVLLIGLATLGYTLYQSFT